MLDTLRALVEAGETYVILLPAYVILLAGERLAHASLRRGEPWDLRDSVANLIITGGFLGLDLLVGHLLPVAVMAVLYEHAALWHLPDGLGGWAVAFLLHDLAWYVDHRLAHRVGLFWALHHVHHSSTSYNMTVASRGFVFDNTLLTRPTFYLLPLLGVSPVQYIAVRVVTSVWGIAQHTRLVGRLGALDRVFATPSNHRVHHGTQPEYLDRNYGEVLIVWDRLFGTWQPERAEPRYGVVAGPVGNNPLRIEVAGLRALANRLARTPRWRDRLKLLVMPPGWSPPSAP